MPGGLTAGGEQRDIDIQILKRGIGQFTNRVSRSVEFKLLACAACGSKKEIFGNGELAFFQDLQEFPADHACSSDYCDTILFHDLVAPHKNAASS